MNCTENGIKFDHFTVRSSSFDTKKVNNAQSWRRNPGFLCHLWKTLSLGSLAIGLLDNLTKYITFRQESKFVLWDCVRYSASLPLGACSAPGGWNIRNWLVALGNRLVASFHRNVPRPSSASAALGGRLYPRHLTWSDPCCWLRWGFVVLASSLLSSWKAMKW